MPRRWLVLCCLSLLPMGCADRLPTNPATYSARGKVYLDGTPVRYGRVCLVPFESSHGAHCWGNIGPDGGFALRTFTDDDGAVPGDYKVYIEPYSPAVNGPVNGKATVIPKRYQDPETSPLTLTIVDDGSELPPLRLER
jgi:hypothetical protein